MEKEPIGNPETGWRVTVAFRCLVLSASLVFSVGVAGERGRGERESKKRGSKRE